MRGTPTPSSSVVLVKFQALEVNLLPGGFYVDGPVFLKSGISLVGLDFETGSVRLLVHGSGTGADGIIVAEGVSGASVSIYAEIGGSGNYFVRTIPPSRRRQVQYKSDAADVCFLLLTDGSRVTFTAHSKCCARLEATQKPRRCFAHGIEDRVRVYPFSRYHICFGIDDSA